MPAKKAESFGGCLYAIRCEKDLSLRAMSRVIGMSPAYINHVENERRMPPPLSTVEAWATALQLSGSTLEKLLSACRRAQPSDGPMAKDAKRVMAICRRLGSRIPADALQQFEQRLRDVL